MSKTATQKPKPLEQLQADDLSALKAQMKTLQDSQQQKMVNYIIVGTDMQIKIKLAQKLTHSLRPCSFDSQFGIAHVGSGVASALVFGRSASFYNIAAQLFKDMENQRTCLILTVSAGDLVEGCEQLKGWLQVMRTLYPPTEKHAKLPNSNSMLSRVVLMTDIPEFQKLPTNIQKVAVCYLRAQALSCYASFASIGSDEQMADVACMITQTNKQILLRNNLKNAKEKKPDTDFVDAENVLLTYDVAEAKQSWKIGIEADKPEMVLKDMDIPTLLKTMEEHYQTKIKKDAQVKDPFAKHSEYLAHVSKTCCTGSDFDYLLH